MTYLLPLLSFLGGVCLTFALLLLILHLYDSSCLSNQQAQPPTPNPED
jgi:hypothetical protein